MGNQISLTTLLSDSLSTTMGIAIRPLSVVSHPNANPAQCSPKDLRRTLRPVGRQIGRMDFSTTTASLKQLVRLAHQRWAIEQQYQELRTELGLDHFVGRSFPGWRHHVVLTAVAYAFLQKERMRHDVDPALTLPAARAIVTEIFTALLFAQKPYYLKRIQELQKIQLRI
jgi:hypothetical protein